MKFTRLLVTLSICCPPLLHAQGTLADYQRAAGLRTKYTSAALNIAETPRWLDGSRFWYRKSVTGGHAFFLVNVETGAKAEAFDHEKLAAALSKATGVKYTALALPYSARPTPNFNLVDQGKAVEVIAADFRWKCSLSDYTCQKLGPAPPGFSRRGASTPPPNRALQAQQENRPVPSPDGTQEALIQNYNICVRPKGKTAGTMLSFDGSEDNYYSVVSIAWSPDSKKLAAYRVRPGYKRQVHYVESSPSDQLQPKYMTIEYAKPGDVLDLQQPVLFSVDDKKETIVDNTLFPNPYELSRPGPVWRKDSRSFTFEYNQRGHQVYRVIEVDAATGRARAIIDEQAKTFFCYSGKKYRHDIDDGKEIVWMSERDGWNRLYLYDGVTGKIKNQITKGDWVGRGVDYLDTEKRQILFHASGMNPGKDPYFVDYYRINLDGSGLTPFTHGDGNHSVVFSPDHKYYVDTWSRIDLPPVSELHRADDRSLVSEVERGDIAELEKLGWHAPEVFVAKGRDGKTDIWGVIIRPPKFDPAKKYPVIENIYAGPQDSFVPKSFAAYNQMQSMAELGFVVVQIDGMGTSNRSKAFHDVAWKDLADAGFPDRILWHKAVAAKYPWYDIPRVGIYGTSAGGQNALGGLLFHPEFYKAGVASCGCHDNRMDKIWWNEQWMGWPLGPEYIACSNTENANRLQGHLMLFVGEMDTNVDPSSTMQVVNALIKNNKAFDLLVTPGANHGSGGAYGDRKRYDFFVHHLLGIEPPDWNHNPRVADLMDALNPTDPADEIDEAASFFRENDQ
ncbi:MAG TPA: prolyl oligopeptidase family serine peptidase [Bryobacteraceae bacterium]|nr:prolyl oligopeptidase family serine peptidase [Bryobacteraceae bacterium]